MIVSSVSQGGEVSDVSPDPAPVHATGAVGGPSSAGRVTVMAENRAERQEDTRSPSPTASTATAPVARMLANPRRTRRA